MPLWDFKGNVNLSIHDLTRRSTEEVFDYINRGSLSIHDLTRRSTSLLSWTVTMPTSFNSRPHKEVDDDVTQPENLKKSFNSRPHKEVDQLYRSHQSRSTELSIHDLTRRSTFPSVSDNGYSSVLSIHDLTRRSTFCTAVSNASVFFQFTTSQGGRPARYSLSIISIIFQFTTSQGGRRPLQRSSPLPPSFNSRPHKEVDSAVF